jgi:hypothetical protein
MKVDDFDCSIITTYPGTPYYDLAVISDSVKNIWTYTHPQTGDRLHAYDVNFATTPDYYKGDPNGGYCSYVFTDQLTASEIVRLRDLVENEVRGALRIPFYPSNAALRYEHSMGQSIPQQLLRRSAVYEQQI